MCDRALDGSRAQDAWKGMSKPLEKHVIFVVDDEELLRRAIARVLRNPSYVVYFFENPVEALARIDELRPVLIISDNMMPKMTGFDFLRRVRAERPATRTLMLTGGYIADEVRASVATGEIGRLIVKPWMDDVLGATVRELLESK
jgi:CheY-like chemotaxis protein